MAASYLPSIFVPIVGWVFPAVAMALLFIYIEREDSPPDNSCIAGCIRFSSAKEIGITEEHLEIPKYDDRSSQTC